MMLNFKGRILSVLLVICFQIIVPVSGQASQTVSGEDQQKLSIPGGIPGEKSNAQVKTKLSSSVSFEDLLVQGKYHFSDEAVTTVEEDKVLDALLGVRKDFKDRIKRSASRR